MKIRRLVRAIAFGMAITGIVSFGSGCYRNKSKESSSGILRLYQKEDVKSWDPALAYDRTTSGILPNLYETLYQYSYVSANYQLEPLLAAGLPRFSQDGLTLVIPISRGIFFQDDPCFKATLGKGREVKAADFIFAIKRLALPSLKSPGWSFLDGRILGINAFREQLLGATQEQLRARFDEGIPGLRAVDDWTLQFKLTRPDPKFLYFLAMTLAAPVPQEAIEAYGDSSGQLTSHSIGTGAFTLAKLDAGREIILERNPNYRGEKFSNNVDVFYRRLGFAEDSGKPMPFLNQVQFKIQKEGSSRWSGFLAGEVDLAEVPSEIFKQVLADGVNLTPELVKKGIRLSTEAGLVTHFVGVNLSDSLLGRNKFLRQALSSALNRDEWVASHAEGRGVKMVGLVSSFVADHPSHAKLKYDFDLDRSRELLKKAGFADGVGLAPLTLDLNGDSTEEQRLGEYLKTQWEKIGLKIQVIPNSFTAYLEKVKAGQTQLYLGTWAIDFPDVTSMYQLFASPSRAHGAGDGQGARASDLDWTHYRNSQYDKLFHEAFVLPQGKRRADLIQKLEDLLQEDCPWIYGYFGTSYVVTQPWLLNFRASDVILNKLKYLRLSSDLKIRYSQ